MQNIKRKYIIIDDKLENIEAAQRRGWNVCLASALEFEKIKESVYVFLED